MTRKLSLCLALAMLLSCVLASPVLADGAQDGPVTYYTRTNAGKESAPDNELVLAEIIK